MKILFLSFALLIINSFSYSQSMVIHKYGGIDTLSIAEVDSITFLPFQCGLSKVRYGDKIYNTVQIGSQCWLKENLDIGNRINGYQWPENNGVIEKYCYNDDPANCITYGGLYLWDEAMQYETTTGARGICPVGWHMPTTSECQILATAVSNDGNALKEIGQGTGLGAGTNTSGFSGLLAGAKGYSGGPYQGMGAWVSFWIGQLGTPGYVWSMHLTSTDNTAQILDGGMTSWGMTIRCIKD